MARTSAGRSERAGEASRGRDERAESPSGAWASGGIVSTPADLNAFIRAYLARMRVRADQARALLGDTLAAIEAEREDAMLGVLEVKASAGEAATEVTELAMRVCGGAAFRREVGVERAFRDARAATVMAPTTDMLYDFTISGVN